MTLQNQNPLNAMKIDHVLVAGRTREDIKLAHRAAALLQQEIIFGRLESGRSLGTAAEIRTRHNLGRWAFREAIGILELRGVARLRPGPGGGVMVAAPDLGNLVNLTLLYLYATHEGVQELVEAERAVLVGVVKKLLHLTSRLDQSAEPPGPHPQPGFARFLARQTGNFAIELAVEFVESVREACIASFDADPALEKCLWRAICQGQREAALAALDQYLAARDRGAADLELNLEGFSASGAGTGKSAYRLALRMLREIVEHPDDWNASLGSEAAMGLRFNANADIVRQAVRLIEDLEVVAPRRGRNGGAMLRTPDTASIASLIPHLLAKKQLSVSACFEAVGLLNVEIARLAATRAKNQRPGDGDASDEAIDFWDMIMLDRRIQAHAGNALLASIERGLLLYSCVIEPPSSSEIVPIEKMLILSQAILRAVENGDVEQAGTAALERFQFMSLRFTAPERFGSESRPH